MAVVSLISPIGPGLLDFGACGGRGDSLIENNPHSKFTRMRLAGVQLQGITKVHNFAE